MSLIVVAIWGREITVMSPRFSRDSEWKLRLRVLNRCIYNSGFETKQNLNRIILMTVLFFSSPLWVFVVPFCFLCCWKMLCDHYKLKVLEGGGQIHSRQMCFSVNLFPLSKQAKTGKEIFRNVAFKPSQGAGGTNREDII